MKLNALNTLIESFESTVESTLQATIEKGEVSKTDTLSTEKDYLLILEIKGQQNGIFGVGISEETTKKIVEKMSGGQLILDSINEIATSCIEEFGGIIKSKIIENFSDNNIELEIEKITFSQKESISEIRKTFIRSIAKSEVGDFEINLHIK